MFFDINAVKRKLLVKYPFFGTVIANVQIKQNDSISTIATDGRIIYFNSKYMNLRTQDEQVFLLAHEICHIAFNHIFRSKNKDMEAWNIATDAVVNAFLKQDGLKMPETGVNIEEAIKYDAEELYEKLIKDKESKREQNNNANNGGSKSDNSPMSDGANGSNDNTNSNGKIKDNSTNNDFSDSNDENLIENVEYENHNLWKEAIKRDEEKKEANNSIGDEEDNELKKVVEEISKTGEKESFKMNEEVRDRNFEELKRSLSKEAAGAGDKTSENLISVNNVGESERLIDWRYLLKEEVNYDQDWSYRDAIIEDGILRANLIDIPIPETEILLDTSGSIDKTLFINFLKECKSILDNSRVKVGCFDTKFYGFQEIRTEDDIDNMEFKGGGGTDFDVAVNAFSNRVENKIIFTDGDANMPDKHIDATWIVFGGIKIKPVGGKVIYIDEDYLNNLKFSNAKKL